MTSAEDEGRYSQFLEAAITQGFLQLMEPNVTLIVREKDIERAQKAAEAAAETYSQLSGRQVAFDIQGVLGDERYISVLFGILSKAYRQPSISSGGVKLANGNKRTKIDNTLDERLRLLEDRVSRFFGQQDSVTDIPTDVTRDQERFVRSQREQKVLFISLCSPLGYIMHRLSCSRPNHEIPCFVRCLYPRPFDDVSIQRSCGGVVVSSFRSHIMDSADAHSLPPNSGTQENGTHLWIPEPEARDSTSDPVPSSSRAPQLLKERLYVGNLSPTVDE